MAKALWKSNTKIMDVVFKYPARFQLTFVVTVLARSEERPRIKCS